MLGLNSATQTKAMHGLVGYMSQQFTLYNDLTAAENIRFYGQVYGLSSGDLRRRQAEILHMAGPGRARERADRRACPAAGSSAWRWAAPSCTVRGSSSWTSRPPAWTRSAAASSGTLIYDMARDGVTVLVTTHYMDEAELCQRIGFISQGRLVALDTPARLKQTQMRGEVLEIARVGPRRGDARVEGCPGERPGAPRRGGAVRRADPCRRAQRADAYRETVRSILAVAGVEVRSIEWIAPTLEDVFISSVKGTTSNA